MIANKKTIIIADSCSGGISVLKYVSTWAGKFHVQYLADYEKNPFGLKSNTEIEDIVISWFKNLSDKHQVSLFIIACNTASVASKNIRQKLVKKYGIPVVNMIDGVKLSLENNHSLITGKTVAIMATKYTIESKVYQQLVAKLRPKNIIGIIATNSEKVVANGKFKTLAGKKVISQELAEYKSCKIDTIILACTCFKSIESQITSILGSHVKCLDPALEVSQIAQEKLAVTNKRGQPKITIWNTSRQKDTFKSIKIACKTFINKVTKINNLELTR